MPRRSWCRPRSVARSRQKSPTTHRPTGRALPRAPSDGQAAQCAPPCPCRATSNYSKRSIGGVVADAGPTVQWLQYLGQEDAAGAGRIARNLAKHLPAMALVEFGGLEAD